MAYEFTKVKKQIAEPDEKQDIFAGEQQGFGLAAQQEADKTAPVQKGGSTAIGAGASGMGAGTTAASAQAAPVEAQAPRGASEARQQVFEQQQAPMPSGLSGLSKELAGRGQALKTGEAEYLKTAHNQTDFGLDPETVEQATLGDEEALTKVSGLLGQRSPGVMAARFDAGESSVPNIGAIQTAGGLEQFLRRQEGPQYTAGEADYDVARLQASPHFQAARQNLAERQAQYFQEADRLERELPGLAQGYHHADLQAAQEGVRGELGTLQQGINEAIIAQRQAKEQEIADLLAGAPEAADALGIEARRELIGDIPTTDPIRALIEANELGIDPSDYYSVTEDPVTRQHAVTEDQARQWNQIQSLLGIGGQLMSPDDIGELSSFDTQAYQQALQDAARAGLPPPPTPQPPPTPEEVEQMRQDTIGAYQQVQGDTGGVLENRDAEVLAADPMGLGSAYVAGEQTPYATPTGAIAQHTQAGDYDTANKIAAATAGIGGMGGMPIGGSGGGTTAPTITPTDPAAIAAGNTAAQQTAGAVEGLDTLYGTTPTAGPTAGGSAGGLMDILNKIEQDRILAQTPTAYGGTMANPVPQAPPPTPPPPGPAARTTQYGAPTPAPEPGLYDGLMEYLRQTQQASPSTQTIAAGTGGSRYG